MKNLVSLILLALAAAAISAAWANDNSRGTTQQLTEAQRTHIREQVNAIKQRKVQEGEQATSEIRSRAVKQGETVERTVKDAKDRVDKDTEGMSWVYGHHAATAAGKAAKGEIEARGQAEKQRIEADAKRQAAARAQATKKAVENVNQTVEGLKSQVSKNGEYGLQVKGSNLHVRNYGGGASSKTAPNKREGPPGSEHFVR